MRRLALIVGLVLAAMTVAAGSARAQEAFRQAAPLSNADLASVRAGFIDMDGVEFSFGVLTQTFLNGQLSLSTQLNVNSTADVTRAVSGGAGTLPSAGGATLSVAAAGGLTTVFQSITSSQVANVVATSASNQTIRQDTAVSVALLGFQQNQATYALQHTVSNLNMILGVSTLARH